jgi:hypothetical protein
MPHWADEMQKAPESGDLPGEAEEAAARGHEGFDSSIPPIQPGDHFSFKSGQRFRGPKSR